MPSKKLPKSLRKQAHKLGVRVTVETRWKTRP